MMDDSEAEVHQVRPDPNLGDGHPMPRRAHPEASVTLLQHRIARGLSMRPETGSNAVSDQSPRRHSTGESHDTGQSDPKKWFDMTNSHAPAAFDHATMDVDPPFYLKHSDSSNEEAAPTRGSTHHQMPFALQSFSRPMGAQSSSAEDYRSVIDDLTIENKRLKDELRRYRQFGPELLRKDRLFEIKVHGLGGSKRRELESTLRDFAASLGGSQAASSERKKSSKHASRLQGSSLDSKHASSSSSHSRPVDSAYASMSTGPSSTTLSHCRPTLGRLRSSADHKVETYLQEIPEGLFPRPVAMTDKEKKKLVVRRLEQLFTGRMSGRHRFSRNKAARLTVPDVTSSAPPVVAHVAQVQEGESSREARIELHGKMPSAEALSISNSNGEIDSGDVHLDSGGGSNENRPHHASLQNGDLAEQRATKARELDPDRVQVPSENMQYIRHLGVTAPQDIRETKFRPQDVSNDAEGWIHLNLLCNLAQLHILNVTPDYIRSAISERSTKFQLSRDGRKIRWRGGVDGTKFSSDSSGDSSQRSPGTECTDGSNGDGQRKRQRKTDNLSDPPCQGEKKQGKLGPQNSASSNGFHYKPLFLRNRSSSAETSVDETGSQPSYGAVERSNMNSRSTGFVSGSGSSPRKKRRNDGAIIYYNGAPFCTDLSGDPGDISPDTYLVSSTHEPACKADEDTPALHRTMSGSWLPYRPLVDGPVGEDVDMDDEPERVEDEDEDESSDSDAGFSFPWCSEPATTQLKPLESQLEPCGLGGVTPEDHFAVLVVTKQVISGRRQSDVAGSDKTSDSIVRNLTTSLTSLPRLRRQPPTQPCLVPLQIVTERYKALKPLPLPPPAMFYPPFTETTESDDSGFEDGSDYEDHDSDLEVGDFGAASKRANPEESTQGLFKEGKAISGTASGSASVRKSVLGTRVAPNPSFPPCIRPASRGAARPVPGLNQGLDVHPDSSCATAGGEASGYSSSVEDDS